MTDGIESGAPLAGWGASAAPRIAVFRALQLGDMLCAVPALRALRRACPRAHITLIGLPWAAQFAQRFKHYIDDYLVFPGFPGLPETAPRLDAIPRFIESAQQRRFDFLLQLHGSGALSNPLCASLGARHYAGFRQAGGWCPEPDHFVEWEEGEHEIARYLRLLQRLGAPEQGRHLEFPLDRADYRKLCCDNPGLPPRHAYACVHPGSQLPSRRWPAARFAEVADHLAATGLTVVLTGTAQEADITGAVLRDMTMPALDLTGNTELGGLAALIADACILVCNDTGVSHIAAALGTPSVVICCGADPQRWAPLDRDRHRVLHHAVECRPCAHRHCPLAGHPCAAGVEAGAVWETAAALLDDFEPAAMPLRRPAAANLEGARP